MSAWSHFGHFGVIGIVSIPNRGVLRPDSTSPARLGAIWLTAARWGRDAAAEWTAAAFNARSYDAPLLRLAMSWVEVE